MPFSTQKISQSVNFGKLTTTGSTANPDLPLTDIPLLNLLCTPFFPPLTENARLQEDASSADLPHLKHDASQFRGVDCNVADLLL